MTNHAEFETYHRYLRARSRLGYLYRRFWLYPRLTGFLRGSVLDIGCGIGDMLKFRPATVGVDINYINVNYCKSLGLDAIVMDLVTLPFKDERFDGAILDNVLEHIADPTTLLAETKRVLVPGGTLICGVPGAKGYASDSDHKLFYSEQALVDRLARAGFVKKELIRAPINLPALGQIMRQYCIYGIFNRP